MKLQFTLIFIFTMFMSFVATAECVTGDCENGQGTFMYQDSTVYVGAFKEGKANGYGVCYYANNDKYIGEWKDHNYHGKGTFYSHDGEITTGNWENGQIIARGTKANNEAMKNPPKVWAVIVGVANYKTLNDLSYTDDDATKMYNFLKSPEGGAIADEQVSLLVDEKATKTQILRTVQNTFAKAASNDLVLFYFSGHGLKNALLPSDYDGTNNMLYHEELVSMIDESEAKYKICLVDACHSGGLMAAKGNTNTTTAASYYKAFEGTNGGTVYITSSKEEEASIEDKGLRQGIFSHFLIKGLQGQADADGDNVVTINEVFTFVQGSVTSYTDNYQTPMIHGEYDDNMPISVVRD